MKEFFQLILIALGKASCLDAPLSSDKWESVYQISKKQSVLGVIYKAIEKLPVEQLPPRPIKVRFALVAEKIVQMNSKMNVRAASMTQMAAGLGLESCVLKGQSVASLYPWPSARQTGDIDLWVKGDYRHILKAVQSRWKVSEVFYHHAGIHPFNDSLEVEVHFTPNWMNSPFTNRRLQNYFKSRQDAQFSNFSSEYGFSRPTSDFDCVFSAVHIFRHLLLEGIGLRQVMDYYFILSSSSVQDRQKAAVVLESLGMKRFMCALMYVMKAFFHMDDSLLICPADSVYGEFLRDEILLAGNFGKFDERYEKYNSKANIFKKAANRFKRLPHYISIAPSEVIWAPVFKIWQHAWQIWNRF